MFVLLCGLLLFSLPGLAEASVQAAFSSALRSTPAVGVVLDAKTGRMLAEVTSASSQASAPGSILKPLFLAGALQRHYVLAQTTVFCRRDLRIMDAGHEWSLPCTHPQRDVALDAREALAYSCNQYFTALADRIPGTQLGAIVEHYGLPPLPTSLTREQKQLVVLGVQGISVTPAQIAAAYRKLLVDLNDAAVDPVRLGLRDSVGFGMAHNAAVPGMEILGKTGTTLQGGWFAGSAKERVVAIYLPHGNGADAARLAQKFFLAGKRSAPANASDLTVELFSARSVAHLTATPLFGLQRSFAIDSLPSGRSGRQVMLSGKYRLQVEGAEPVVAAGQWTIRRQPDGLHVLLTLPSEAYVAAALAGEAAPDEPAASLKAMAIILRTFALENANRHRTQGFGLCDSTHCQALRFGKLRPEIERAVRETAGETLWSGELRTHIYYTQHCGGRSESAATVWPSEQADYLAGNHADLYCLRRGSADWHTRIALSQLSAVFHGQGWKTPSPIEDIRVVRRTAEGRAKMLEVTGQGAPALLSASSFHFAVDRQLGWNQVRSDWYNLTRSGADLEIQGKGYGHGVGLCQAGAYEMAAEGKTEQEILSFYFPGTVAGISAEDGGWHTLPGAGWTLLTTNPSPALLREGNEAWTKARALFPGGYGAQGPVVQEFPTTELFRQTTGEPGWMLASTRGNVVSLQPEAVREINGGTRELLLHEFLHVLVEQQAGAKAPLWLREGLVEMLAGPAFREAKMDLPVGEVEEALAHPLDARVSRHAHEVAAHMAAQLCARYGMPAVRDFLRDGVPAEALRTAGS